MDSISKIYPDSNRYVLIVDKEIDITCSDNFNIINVKNINIPNLNNFLFRYSILEANTAVKPFMFEYLFNLGFDKAIYLDPDIYLYEKLDEVDNLSGKLAALTPHILETVTNPNATEEVSILNCGVFNLGFIALYKHKDLNRFLNWWKSKLEYECLVTDKLFVDQKWIDMSLAFFDDIHIIKDYGYNIAYWNIFERDSSNIKFMHFSGISEEYISKYNKKISKDNIDSKFFDTYQQYIKTLKETDSYSDIDYHYNYFSNGVKIHQIYRDLYNKSNWNQNSRINPFENDKLMSNSLFIKNTNLDKIGFYTNEQLFLDRYIWMNKQASIKITKDRCFISIDGYHDNSLNPDVEISCLIDGIVFSINRVVNGEFKIDIAIDKTNEERVLTISCNKSFIPSELGLNNDNRELSTRIGKIIVNNVDILKLKKN